LVFRFRGRGAPARATRTVPMRTATLALILLALPSVLVAGCKNEAACTKARLANASAWESVKKDAQHFEFQGAPGYEDLNATQKRTHLETWKTIEEQAELVFESFAFDKIGWDTADKARDRVVKEFNGYFDKDKYAGFQALLDSAEKHYTEAEAACR
jgi:hypothetical protein